MNGILKFSKIFEEGRIGQLKIKNRIVMAPMGTHFADNGKVSQQQIAFFAERAKGNVGLIETENALVNCRLVGISAPVLRMDRDEYIEGHSELINMVHAYGSKISMQLYQPGRHSIPDPVNGKMPAAPSPVPVNLPGSAEVIIPHELTIEEIYELIESFGLAALRAKHAGYDAVEIHGAHGYLIHEFMSPYTNRRSDIFGGSIENQIRLPVEIIKEVKKKAGHDFPVIFRMIAEETMSCAGYTIEDSKLFVKFLEEAGVDAIHVSMGSWEDKDGVSRNICPMSYEQGWRLPLIEAIKSVATVPVIGVGVFREPELVEKVLQEGKADFIALGRQLLADPYWVKKTAAGQTDNIRKCISCNYCINSLITSLFSTYLSTLHCAINPEVGRELDYSCISVATVKKKVMIIGSGPAGMEAARIAAQRGHEVALYEKRESLGAGQLALTYKPPHKQKIKWLSDFLIAEIQSAGIEVHLNTEATLEMVQKIKPDVIIVASGAEPFIPDIPGIHRSLVSTASEVLSGNVVIERQKVAVLGQYSTGAETAEFLADKGNKVTIISRSPLTDLAKGALQSNRMDLIRRLKSNNNITILNEYNVREIKDNGITIVDQESNENFIELDRVVIARGMVPANELGKKLISVIPEVYIVGDAARPRDIASAIFEGSLIARNI